MSGFFNRLAEFLKNSHRTTRGVGPNCTHAQRDAISDDDEAVNVEPTPQEREGDEVYYLKEFNRLQPPKFDGSSGPETTEG